MEIFCKIDADTEVTMAVTMNEHGELVVEQEQFDEAVTTAMQIPRIRQLVYNRPITATLTQQSA